MVPRGESDDLVAVGIEDQRVGGNENRTDMIVFHVRERRRNVRDVSYREPRDLEPQRLSRASKFLRLGISAVVQKGHARELGDRLLEKPELLAAEILQRRPGNVPSWAGETRHQPRPNRIYCSAHDDWYRTGGVTGCADRHPGARHDHV